MQQITVNRDVCDEVAALLASKAVPEDREEIAFEGFGTHELGNLLFFVVAICHQTSAPGRRPLAGEVGGKLLRGWDYLLQRFVEVARSNKSLLLPASWQNLTPDELTLLFRNPAGEDLLSDVSGRASLVRDLGARLLSSNWNSVDLLYRFCDGRVASGVPNLVSVLSDYRAYGDPVRKKTFFFLSLMQNTGLWQYADPELLGAPVDYHEVRGHLRIGTVTVRDADLALRLRERRPVTAEEDIAIRDSVLEAIMYLSEATGLRNPSRLHYLFWNVFRNYCTREAPNCLGVRLETYLPERYQSLTARIAGRAACPFCPVCRSAAADTFYYEHLFETDYY